MAFLIAAARSFRDGLSHGAGWGLGCLFVVAIGGLVAQTLTTFAAGDVISASAINQNFSELRTKTVEHNGILYQNNAALNQLIAPIGGIVAWHKDLGGVPALGSGWQECNGTTVTDPDSPLVGQTLPDLNGDARFLRGGATSGALQLDSLQNHNHFRNPSLRDEKHYFNDGSPTTSETVAAATGLAIGSGSETGIISPGARADSETRPINMSVVWVMRIK